VELPDVAGAAAAAAGTTEEGAEADCIGGEYNDAKRLFSASAVSYFTGETAAGDGATGCNDPLEGPGPAGPAETGTPVSAIVGVTAGGSLVALATAATTATGTAAEAAVTGGVGRGAGD